MSQTLGRHILVEFFECSAAVLNDVISIERAMVAAAETAQATVINSTFHHFSPFGVSGVVVIQESHLAIHTWPEFGYAAVDIFTCGTSVNPWIAYDFLKKAFQAGHGSALEINRGQTDLLKRSSMDFNKHERSDDSAFPSKPAESAAHTPPPAIYKRDIWFTDKDENRALSIRYHELLYREQSPYQLVQVLNTHAYGKMLTIDGMVMCTEKDEFVYHELITHPAFFTKKDIRKVLVIGGGDGGTVRELVKHPSVEAITMIEIDEKVVEASRLHLPTLSKDLNHPKLDLRFADGIAFVEASPAEAYDLIIVDGSDPAGPAEGLFSESFFKNLHKCLRPGGILTLQSESPHFNTKAFAELYQCLGGIFGAGKVHTYLGFIPTYPTGMWGFNYACKGDTHPITNLDEAAANAFSKTQGLKYYNATMHKAAFSLPPFVEEILKG